MAKIMLCDDSRTILSLLEKKLKDAGHEIVAKAADGIEGFKLYSAFRPEILLLDVTMPNRDGKECLQDIMKFDAKAKVIMVSALLDNAVVATCLARGAKAFVSKDKLYKDEDFRSEILNTIDKVMKVA